MPLPKEEVIKFEKEIEEVEEVISKIEEKVGKEIIDETPDLILTYMWASVILGRMEGIIRSIEPSNLEKSRGTMPEDLKGFLEKEINLLKEKIKALRNKYTTAKFY